MNTRYHPILLPNVAPELIEQYFLDLIDSGLATKRFPMYYPVTFNKIFRYIHDQYNMVMMVVDNQNQSICGEITLNMFQGKAAFAHFSIHPSYLKEDYASGVKEVIDILCESKDLQTLIAWIPETNVKAYNFIKRIGFKPQCKVDNTCYVKKLDKYVSSFQSIYNAEY